MPRASGGFSGSGGRGGGGFSSGGSFGGGGYHGGPHHHHHYGGFFFFPWRRPYYGYGGGFFGGLFGLFFLPLIILILAGIFLVSSIVSLVSVIAQGGVVQYSAREFRDFALAEYDAAFDPASAGYEDNILIVFSTVEGYNEYHVQAMIGNNIIDDIAYMLDEGGTFDQALTASLLAEDYSASLDRDLYSALTKFKLAAANYSSSFLEGPASEHKESKVINRDEALTGFTGEYVTKALNEFTEETGIPIVLVIEDEEDVFGKTIPAYIIVSGVISLGVCIFAGVWIYKSVKAKKRAARDEENRRNGTDYNDPRYWN